MHAVFHTTPPWIIHARHSADLSPLSPRELVLDSYRLYVQWHPLPDSQARGVVWRHLVGHGHPDSQSADAFARNLEGIPTAALREFADRVFSGRAAFKLHGVAPDLPSPRIDLQYAQWTSKLQWPPA